MIKIEKTDICGWEAALRGMRNPKNSWDKADSNFTDGITIGPNDYDLAMRLSKGGPVHGKFRRMITVYADVTAPLYWWKEYDTYKVGTVADSCSTMHKIQDKEFTIDDFSCEHLIPWGMDILNETIFYLNTNRLLFLENGDKKYWWQMIQLLPTSYNQKRTIETNYEVLSSIYKYRKDHKLDEWHTFCDWIESLPYSEIITGNVNKMNPDKTNKDKFVSWTKDYGKERLINEACEYFFKNHKMEGGYIHVDCTKKCLMETANEFLSTRPEDELYQIFLEAYKND